MLKIMSTTKPFNSLFFYTARKLLGQGHHPLPCDPVKKHPLIDWKRYQDQQPTEEEITEWSYQFPTCGIGLTTGRKQNLVVIDIDVKSGGMESAKKLAEEYGVRLTDDTTVVESPSTGIHIWSEYPEEGLASSASVLAPGIDIRADGGFIVVPPTKGYRYLSDTPLKKLPEFITLRLSSTQPEQISNPDEPSPLIPVGQRNDRIYRFARSIERPIKGDRELMRGILQVFNESKLETPLPQSELDTVIQSISSHSNLIPFTPQTVDSWIDLADPSEKWVVDNLVPEEAFVILSAPPKAGKSTLARHLAVAVAKGEPEFLGERVRQGKVLYMALEESPRRVRSSFRKLGITESDPLLIHFGSLTTGVSSVYDYLEREKPSLVIIDTIGRVRQKGFEINDYGGTSDWLEIWMNASHDLGMTVIGIFHTTKNGRNSNGYEALFSVLGSTAITASIDQLISIRRKKSPSLGEEIRTIETVSRISDYPEKVYQMDGVTERLSIVGTVQEINDKKLKELILEALPVAPSDPIPFKEIEVEARKQSKTRILTELVTEGLVERSGEGKPNSPHLYLIKSVPKFPAYTQEQGNRDNSIKIMM